MMHSPIFSLFPFPFMRHFFYLIGCGSEVTLRTFFWLKKKFFFFEIF
jgi:hypothetical protein